MKLEILKSIGSELKAAIGGHPLSSASIGRGAAGDRTYQIDKLAEDIIIKGLGSSGEPLTVVSEEAGIVNIKGGGKRVVVDPIDGSRNAVSGIPVYCSSIAVSSGDSVGDVELSYIINLVSGEEFWAEKSKGAYRNGIQILSQKEDALLLAAYEATNPKTDITRILPLLSAARKTRCLGSTAISLCCVAAGAASVLLVPSPSRSFDFAGGLLIAKEAGAIITDINGRDISGVEIGLERSSTLLASGNAKLHEKALGFLS